MNRYQLRIDTHGMVNNGSKDHDFSCVVATLRQVIKYIVSKRLLYSTGIARQTNITGDIIFDTVSAMSNIFRTTRYLVGH